MHIFCSKAFRAHVLGLCAVFAGAAFTDSTGSMLPLAMGAALALMTTAALVREIRTRSRARRRVGSRTPKPPKLRD